MRGIWDAFPVTEGHALVVTRRHVASWFDATEDERQETLDALHEVRSEIQRLRGPCDYNIGINDGPAAGQTIQHLHVHIIPRRPGDVADPRGGIRHVIPGRGNYLAVEQPPLVTGEVDPLLPHLTRHLEEAASADLAVAFVLESGVDVLEEHLRDLLDRGGRLRILTGDYLAVTDPVALRRLLDLGLDPGGEFDLRVFETTGTTFHHKGTTFHPKSYIFRTDDDGIAYVGSSNLTRPALQEGVEWNYRVVLARDRLGFEAVTRAFDELFQHTRVRTVDPDWVDAYERRRPPLPDRGPIEVARETPERVPLPHEVQREALEALMQTRAEGNAAGLVVIATGLGKTWLAAFDVRQMRARRTLFVAHREEILRQALSTFRRVFPYARLGYFTGDERTPEADVLFASVQTLGRARHLETFDPEAFQYIVVDEFHHAAAPTYRRLLDHFEPTFLLGLTATPERTDGGDLLALCGENLVYRCDLAEGIRRGLLSPFDYYGVPDEVDYQNIPWRSGRFDEDELEAALATRRRAENALDQYRLHAGRRTLAFCVSTRHADFMSRYFADAGLNVAAVHSGAASAPRAASLEALRTGELDMFSRWTCSTRVSTCPISTPS